MYRMPAKDPSSFQWLGSFQAPEPWALVLATQHSSKAAFIISGSGPAVGLSTKKPTSCTDKFAHREHVHHLLRFDAKMNFGL